MPSAMVMPNVEQSLLAVITDQEALIKMSELAFNASSYFSGVMFGRAQEQRVSEMFAKWLAS